MNLIKGILFTALIIIYSSVDAAVVTNLYCFRGEDLAQVHKHLSVILLPQDKIDYFDERNCLGITQTHSRMSLMERWLGRKYKYRRDAFTESTSHHTNLKHCLLELIKLTDSQMSGDDIKLGKRSDLSVNQSKKVSSSTSKFLIGAGKHARMQINSQVIEVVCKPRAKNIFLSINIMGLDMGYASDIEVIPGQEINVGNIVNEINEKASNANINTGVEKSSRTGSSKSTYILKVKES